MKCNWTKRAQAEYKRVVKYIAEVWGKPYALNFIHDVEACDKRLFQYPEMGFPESILANRKKYKYRSYIVSRYNKIIYTIDKNRTVTIVDMWDMRREPESLSSRIKSL